MKDTNDNQNELHTQQKSEKINFQSLRECMFNDYCCINTRKCNFDLLFNEFRRS